LPNFLLDSKAQLGAMDLFVQGEALKPKSTAEAVAPERSWGAFLQFKPSF